MPRMCAIGKQFRLAEVLNECNRHAREAQDLLNQTIKSRFRHVGAKACKESIRISLPRKYFV